MVTVFLRLHLGWSTPFEWAQGARVRAAAAALGRGQGGGGGGSRKGVFAGLHCTMQCRCTSLCGPLRDCLMFGWGQAANLASNLLGGPSTNSAVVMCYDYQCMTAGSAARLSGEENDVHVSCHDTTHAVGRGRESVTSPSGLDLVVIRSQRLKLSCLSTKRSG
jgi:hypothetical protein